MPSGNQGGQGHSMAEGIVVIVKFKIECIDKTKISIIQMYPKFDPFLQMAKQCVRVSRQ